LWSPSTGSARPFLFPTLLVPALAAIYGVGYWPQQAHPESAARVRVFLGLLAGAMTTLLIARDAVLFLMAFEVMTLSAFFLVTTEDGRSEVREAGWVYLAASHTSFLCCSRCSRAARSHRVLRADGRRAFEHGSRGAERAVPAGPRRLWHQGRRDAVPRLASAAHASAPSHVSA
jgi:hypothetical protein